MKNSQSSNISTRLKELRQSLSLTQGEMAERMGVSFSAFQKYEMGLRFPSIPGLRNLAVKMDVSMDWLLFNKGPVYYGGKRLNTELDRLKVELEEAGRRIEELNESHRKELHDQAEKIHDQAESMRPEPELQELIDEMNKDTVLYHEILALFSRFKRKE